MSSLSRWEGMLSEMPLISRRYSPRRQAPMDPANRMAPVQRLPIISSMFWTSAHSVGLASWRKS